MPPPGRRRNNAVLLIIFSLALYYINGASAASAVLGIDLGTEYIKAALVKPGIPLEIVLTKDSKRKEAAAVAFKPLSSKSSDPDAFPERVYGGDALALTARYPSDVYSNLKPLLGLSYQDSEIITNYRSTHPGLHVERNNERGTIEFRSESFGEKKESFMVEEILAMELQNIKGNAETFAGKGSTIRDVVITIPAYYTAEEKRAIEVAAELAGLRILALTTDGLSVGINYATSRTFGIPGEGGAKAEYHLVYDMGAGSTTATVLRFQGKNVKDVGRFNKTIQDVQIMGVGWDKTLGGDAFNTVILDDMIEQFEETTRMKSLGTTAADVKKHGRTMAKLWKEAQRMRQVLSANTETSSSFEGLYHDDVNFKYKLTRIKFEDMATKYISEVSAPITQALSMAKLELGDLESIILHGGAVRSPFVQKRLESVIGSTDKIRTNVNSDEAAVMGAAFKAAGISPSFRVKEIRASDVAVHAVGLSWISDGKEKLQKLFLPSSLVGAEKQVPFRTTEDLTFHLHQQSIEALGSDSTRSVPVLRVQTKNLTASVKELTDKFGCLVSDISTKFSIRLSPVNGLPEVTKGIVSCEVVDLGKKGSVVNDVKGFFGFGSKKGDQAPLSDDIEGEFTPDDEDLESSVTTSISEKPTPAPKDSATKKDDKLKEVKKKTETIYIGFSAEPIGLPQISPIELRRIKDRMASFDASDWSRRLREEALNTLEGYTYKVRDILEDEGFIGASTETERADIEAKGRSASDWLYGDGADANRETLKARLKELRDLVYPIQKRKDEAAKRPKEVLLLKEALEQTKTLIGVVKEQSEKASIAAESASASASSTSAASSSSASEAFVLSSSPSDNDFADLDDFPTSSSTTSATAPSDTPEAIHTSTYTSEDLTALTDAYTSVQSWLDENLAAQETLSPTDDPAFLSEDLAKRSRDLNKVVMDLLQKKMKIPAKPKSSGKAKTSKIKGSGKSGKGGKKSSTTTGSSSASVSTTATTEESVVEEPAPAATTTVASDEGPLRGSEEEYFEENEKEKEDVRDEL